MKLFESHLSEGEEATGIYEGVFKPSYSLVDFEKGVQCVEFSHKTDRMMIGTAGGLVAGVKLRIGRDMVQV